MTTVTAACTSTANPSFDETFTLPVVVASNSQLEVTLWDAGVCSSWVCMISLCWLDVLLPPHLSRCAFCIKSSEHTHARTHTHTHSQSAAPLFCRRPKSCQQFKFSRRSYSEYWETRTFFKHRYSSAWVSAWVRIIYSWTCVKEKEEACVMMINATSTTTTITTKLYHTTLNTCVYNEPTTLCISYFTYWCL